MASVTIDLGAGKRATLSGEGGSRQSTEQHSAVAELMLHWPRYAGLTTGAASYLRELGLGVFRGDPVDALKSAIESGRVVVSIDRAAVRGGTAGGQPSTPPFPKANRFASASGVATMPGDKPLPSWATPSDVTASELMGYLESIAASVGNSVTAATGPAPTESTLLGDATSFEYVPDAVSGNVEEIAASTNNPNYAAKMLGYDRDTFGAMIHVMKDENDLGPADNVIWHDNGDVEFKKKIIDNMHNY